jgi:hypothetical protein
MVRGESSVCGANDGACRSHVCGCMLANNG